MSFQWQCPKWANGTPLIVFEMKGTRRMQSAYTVLILLMLVSVSKLVGRVIPLPLPLVQIAAGALLAWPTLGLHVALDPELFLFLFLPSATCGACVVRS
jgi:hypothetical protein